MTSDARPDSPEGEGIRRVRARVTGVVQGVGFRPYVYRLAASLQVTGYVLNDSRGVLLEVEGPGPVVDRFLERLPAEAPPLADVEEIRTEERSPGGADGFEIVETEDSAPPSALVSPDTATCTDCLEELFDPGDRRYRYPFINCTNCGPRFTIVRGVPYDRPLTTMAGFEMCDWCLAEYRDPANRRFHAQPNACPACGPSVRLLDAEGTIVADGRPSGGASAARESGMARTNSEDSSEASDPLAAAAAALRDGAVVAVKGLGGYHLACRADDESAVARLRGRKHREDKPFAVMVHDVDAARFLVRLDGLEVDLLVRRERPIVLARRRDDAAVAPSVAPGHRDLGVMLPYSPLHHILLADVGRLLAAEGAYASGSAPALVMTSGNVSDEPIAYRDDEAMERLGGIADLFLVHDRPIETRTDDSVLRVVSLPDGRRPLTLRRSRGYVPTPLPLTPPAPPVLACGAHLKNTFTLARGGRAWVGHHIGDLENVETLRSFREGVEHFQELFDVVPALVAHDLHPEYLSTRYARDDRDLPTLGVQHHHAHLAACLAEHGEDGPAVAAVFDGTGYGSDGTVWGGEILVGGAGDCERAGALWPVRLPGGEAAIRQPWRMACAWLCELGEETPSIPDALEERVDPDDWSLVATLVRKGVASPMTTSAGRLFDAVSALCGLRARVTYEGQAAIELEMAAARSARLDDGYELPFLEGPSDDGPSRKPPSRRGAKEAWPTAWSPAPGAGGADRRGAGGSVPGLVLDARALVRAVADDLSAGVPVEAVAARFHEGLARGSARACARIAGERNLDSVVLSGGVFQNVRLLERTAALLDEEGLRVLVPERIPPNDGGVSFGQAAVAAAARPS